MTEDRILVPGRTCWRTERAERFACIIDAADYFRHCKAAMLRAKHRIMLVGWDFDTRTAFERGDKTLAGPNQLGVLLLSLLRKRPDLQVFVLKSNLRLVPAFERIWAGVTPVALMNWLSGERIHLAIDGSHPVGAVHHQKMVIIDDSVAFCGGIDFMMDRWDTRQHLPRSGFRQAHGRSYGPRHEVAVAVDGVAAQALGELARDRWKAATGQSLASVDSDRVVWPDTLEPTIRGVDVGIARTMPALTDRTEVREVEALNLAAIAMARDVIYLENQYLASRELVDALAVRLRELDGPDVVIVMPRNSESRLEQSAMDSARHRLLQLLWAADDYGRFGVYWPVSPGGTAIYVHAKVFVVDDRLLRIGSSNLNNRSMGFDSECDVAIESSTSDSDSGGLRRMITSVRHQLISEHLGVSTDEFDAVLVREGSFLKALEALRGTGRTLRRFSESTVLDEASLLAENDLMDPDRVPRSVIGSVQRWLERLAE